MNEEQGLARAVTQQPSQSKGMIDQVVMILQKGASPDELLQMGVPKELIDQAMQMLTQQTQPADENSGLAATMVQVA